MNMTNNSTLLFLKKLKMSAFRNMRLSLVISTNTKKGALQDKNGDAQQTDLQVAKSSRFQKRHLKKIY